MARIKLYYDLHIHTVLSPCGAELMTPNNILNMAMLNKLDLIAITDHNSCKQLPVIMELAKSYDFLVIPGIEVTVDEGFDCLCYFRTLEDALDFDQFLEDYLLDKWNNYTEKDQVITDIYDIELETFNKPLIATSLPYKDLYNEIKKRRGVVVLAHINRPSSSALNTFLLKDIDFDGIEIAIHNKEEFIEKHPNVKNHTVFHNSDAHTLLQLHEEIDYIELEEKSVEAFITYVEEDKNE